jgi:hypothetical protein
MWFQHRFSVSVRCSECGKKLNAVEGLSYRDYDFVLEVEPHTCEPANTGLQADKGTCGASYHRRLAASGMQICDHCHEPLAAKA